MSDYTETLAEQDGKRVQLILDIDGGEYADPRQNDNLGVMAAKGHRHYQLGDYDAPMAEVVHQAIMQTGKPNVVARWLKVFHGATVVLPLGLIDHSGISMYVGSGAHWCDPGGWDSGLIGLIFDTPETREMTGVTAENVEQVLQSEVEEYDKYLRGEVYGYRVEQISECDHGDTHYDELDSCWGFLGHEYAEEAALESFRHYTESKVTT